MRTLSVFLLLLLVAQIALADKLDDMLANASVGLPADTVSLLRSDFNLLKSMKGVQASELSNTIFGTNGKFDGETYLKFFLDRVDDIVFGGCPAEAVACQVPGTRVSHITEFYALKSPVVRLSLLLHESIHGEPSGHLHATCPSVLLDTTGMPLLTQDNKISIAGQQACADNISDPYVAQIVFLRNVDLYCITCSQSTRSDARMFLPNLKQMVINPEVSKAINEDK
jgi:hypothetical protein